MSRVPRICEELKVKFGVIYFNMLSTISRLKILVIEIFLIRKLPCWCRKFEFDIIATSIKHLDVKQETINPKSHLKHSFGGYCWIKACCAFL